MKHAYLLYNMLSSCFFHSVIPDISFPPPNYEYEINQFMAVTFMCIAIGIPPPDIQFVINDTLLDLQFNDHFSLMDPTTETMDITDRRDYVSVVMRQLLLNPVHDEDSNNYTCLATNVNGNDSVEFELVVKGEFAIVDNIYTL